MRRYARPNYKERMGVPHQMTLEELKDLEEREEDRKKLARARPVEPLIPDKAKEKEEAKRKLELALKEEKEMNR